MADTDVALVVCSRVSDLEVPYVPADKMTCSACGQDIWLAHSSPRNIHSYVCGLLHGNDWAETMSDLFDWQTAYPHVPGHRRTKTSKAAAESVKERAPTLCDQVLSLLKAGDYTADECAALMGQTVLSVRPRLSQLKARGLIFDTGETRPNTSSVMASVWRAW